MTVLIKRWAGITRLVECVSRFSQYLRDEQPNTVGAFGRPYFLLHSLCRQNIDRTRESEDNGNYFEKMANCSLDVSRPAHVYLAYLCVSQYLCMFARRHFVHSTGHRQSP